MKRDVSTAKNRVVETQKAMVRASAMIVTTRKERKSNHAKAQKEKCAWSAVLCVSPVKWMEDSHVITAKNPTAGTRERRQGKSAKTVTGRIM